MLGSAAWVGRELGGRLAKAGEQVMRAGSGW